MRPGRLLTAGLLLFACSGKDRGPVATPPTTPPPAERPLMLEPATDDLQGLRFRVSEANPAFDEGDRTPVADARPLPDARVSELLGRLPPIEGAERAAFKLRAGSPPPPRTGTDVQQPWPPPPVPSVAPDAAAGPLEVLRYAPEGDVPLAPHLSVTFNQPMVALTDHATASKTVPVRLTPDIPGKWRWVGTSTALFEADPRLPMATSYTATIPAGTPAAGGATLPADVTWTFQTPPVKVVSGWPSGSSQPLRPVLLWSFDQRVDAAIEGSLALTTGGSSVPIRRATDDEIAADRVVRERVRAAEPERFVAMIPVDPLTPGTSYDLVLRKGAPSAEGPRTTSTDQKTRFRTYDPLRIDGWDCWEQDAGCNPSGQLSIRLNNVLADDLDLASLIKVEPSIPELAFQQWGDSIGISGRFPARKSVTVTVDAALTDTFGQKLGRANSHTFRMGVHDPMLMGPGNDLLVLDPDGPAAVSVYSRTFTALDVQIFAFEPKDLPAVASWAEERGATPTPPPLRRVERRNVPTAAGQAEDLVETSIDLAAHLRDDRGHVLVIVEPIPQPRESWRRSRLVLGVQRTRLGLTTMSDGEAITAWVTDLKTGAPVDGAEVSLLGATQGPATTDADGLARLAPYAEARGPHAIVAQKDGDTAMLPAARGWWMRHGPWARQSPEKSLRWFVFDDRGMVKPGEEANLKGIVRPFLARPGQGLEAFTGAARVRWEARDSRGAAIGEGEVSLSATGSFDVTIPIPDTPNLGPAYVQLTTTWDGRQQTGHHTFQIQEFRRPEFEVSATADPRPYVLGEHAIVTATASYYAGGGLPSAPARWVVTATPTSYRPPGHDDYSFGVWTPWWRFDPSSFQGGNTESLEGETAPDGTHSVRVDFLAVRPPRPHQVRAEVSVEDVNRQRWSAASSVVVHPSRAYVGIALDKPFLERGKEQTIRAIAVDIDGAPLPNTAIDLRVARLTWKLERGEWREVEEDPRTCDLTSGTDPASCALTFEAGGAYRVTAGVADAEGRRNESTAQFWVSGGAGRPDRSVAREEVLLVPSAKTYAVGDVAEVFVQAPFAPAQLLVTLGQDGLLRTERVQADNGSTTLKIPIEDGFTPGVTVSVEAVGRAARLDDEGKALASGATRVAYGGGSVRLSVPPRTRTLAVGLTPAAPETTPGAATHVDLTVRDAAGRPVADAEVAVWMVDEAVLALSGYKLPDPLAVFYAERGEGLLREHSRAMVRLADPDAIAAPTDNAPSGGLGAFSTSGAGRGGGGMAEGATKSVARAAPPPAAMPAMEMAMADEEAPAEPAPGAVQIRTDFRAVALFAPRVRTDASGAARVPVTLPDSLTRYRVFAVAADAGTSFGNAEATIVARKPLMLRPSPPRFLNVGDRAEVPFVVQNPSPDDIVVDFAVRFDNGRVLADTDVDVRTAPDRATAGLRFTVPAEDRREVRVPVGVVDAGTLRWQAVIVGAGSSDAATDELPIWTPATTEAFATYGTITGGATAVPVEAPKDAWKQYGGLEISLSSTELHSLTDGLLYLNSYPYDCTEQLASRVLVNAAMKDVLTAFASPQLPPPDVIAASVNDDLDRLARRQLPNGGFVYWSGMADYPYASLHAAHAMVRARDKGFKPDPRAIERAMNYARNIDRHIPAWYSQQARYTLRAYAVYVRYRAGDVDVSEARRVHALGLDALPLEAQGWLVPVLAKGGSDDLVQTTLRHWNNRVTETAAGAQFAETYGDTNDYVLMHGSRRTDAVLLEALLEVVPKADLNVKIVRALLGHRTKGRWSTTQENAFVLLALDRYFRVYEDVTPNFVARAWIDGGLVGEAAFRGRTTERSHLDVPMAWLAEKGRRELVVGTEGEGRLYYRLGLRYAPSDLQLPPAEHGFSIERRYEPVDDPADVQREADGTWVVRAGARVRVRVTTVVPARRTLVALMDPLPAGLEPMNPALAVTGSIPADPSAQQSQRYWWWSRPWFSHQNLRDERAEAFADLVWPGVHEYVYVATATTPGRYVVPPPRIEEMYHPETFGRGASDRLVVR
jgi:uncharacterized protein YfaS (alpha-2-macroglobulin family)